MQLIDVAVDAVNNFFASGRCFFHKEPHEALMSDGEF